MRHINRKSAPKVTAGRVQRKNNWDETADYYNTEQPMPVVERKRPGAGFRHVLKQRDIHDFIALLPDWNELSKGLNGIVLAAGKGSLFGCYYPGVVHICALPTDLRVDVYHSYYQRRRETLSRLEVPCTFDNDEVVFEFTESSARAYQLLDTFLHELGHHHDALNTKSPLNANRGEPYAEAYARQYADIIWQRYLNTFELF